MNARFLALALLTACIDSADTDTEPDPTPDAPVVMPDVPSSQLPFRMDLTSRGGTGYLDMNLTSNPVWRYLLAVTATPAYTFVVFPPEEREGLDIAWAGYGQPWVRATLLDTPRESLADVHMAQAPGGRVAVVTRAPDRGGRPAIRLQVFDPGEGVVLDEPVPQSPFFGENRLAFPVTTTDLAVFPWESGDIDVIYLRRWTLDGRSWSDVRRNRWDHERGTFRGEEVLLSVPHDGLTSFEEAVRAPYGVDIGGEISIEPLSGADDDYAADQGYGLLIRRRLTLSGAEQSNDSGYHILLVSDNEQPAQRDLVDALADPQWGINRNTPNPGIPNPHYDLAIDGRGFTYAGPYSEGFAADGSGYQRYGPWVSPIPASSMRDSLLVEDAWAAEYAGGWYWQNACGELIVVQPVTPRMPLREWGLPNVWYRERADRAGDDPTASLLCPFDTFRPALLNRGVEGVPDYLYPEVASGPRAAHVAVCAAERPVICSGAMEAPDEPPPRTVPPTFAEVSPADGTVVDADAVTRITVTMDPPDASVGTLCIHDLTGPGGHCAVASSENTVTFELPTDWLQPNRRYRVSATAGIDADSPMGLGAAVFGPPGTPGPVATFRTNP